MSSKNKNKNKNKKNQPSVSADLTTQKLTEQLNSEDEEDTGKDDILEQLERSARKAEARKAERLRKAKEEEIKAEREEKAAAVEQTMVLPEITENEPEAVAAEDNKPTSSEKNIENDVKQFVPHTRRPENEDPTINEAFVGEPEDITGENSVEEVQSEGESETVSEPEHPNKFYLVFAIFVIIMSVIGVVSSVNFCTKIISDIANRTDLKNELTLFLYPIVSVDPPDCDTVEDVPSTIIVESATWKIILTGDNTNYEKLYNTYMYVPAIDVEFAVRSIFGSSVDIVHQTVGTMDIMFTYIEDMNSYLVPINPHYTAYSPRITDLTNIGELYTVTVEYIPPSALAVEGIDFEVSATKTMVYTLSKSKNSAVLHSIKNITRIGNSYEY